MKSDKYQRRFYRDWVKAKDLHHAHIVARETDLQFLTDKPLQRDFVLERIRLYRWDIENYIIKDRRFLTSLKPIPVEAQAPAIIQDMAQASVKAQVGPMAAVAGAIAQCLGKDLLKAGYKEVIVENGGDIFLKTRRIRTVGIYAGKMLAWQGLGLKIRPKDTPLCICASSGTVGHSLSFGCADSVIILSKSASLADAVATATANRVHSKQDLESALRFARRVSGVTGAVIMLKDNLISWGKIAFCR